METDERNVRALPNVFQSLLVETNLQNDDTYRYTRLSRTFFTPRSENRAVTLDSFCLQFRCFRANARDLEVLIKHSSFIYIYISLDYTAKRRVSVPNLHRCLSMASSTVNL